MSHITIQAEDISIRFKDRLLFHIPHLKFGPQEAIYLTGANGVGKTTLLKILSGLQRPTTGKVNLQCNHWFARLFKSNAKNGVIYMHQTPYMFDASVLDNVSYGLKFAIRGRQAQRSEAITALRMVGLETLANEHISVLSGGERNRVHLACMLKGGANVILLDDCINCSIFWTGVCVV